MKLLWLVLVLLVATSCTTTNEETPPVEGLATTVPKAPCPPPASKGYMLSATNAQIKDTKNRLPEISGVVASTQHAGLLWVHNDSGGAAEVYGVGMDGTVQSRVQIETQAKDWEDITYGPCETGALSCIYVGDIGNNGMSRRDLAVVVLEEPRSIVAEAYSSARRYEFSYSDGQSYNSEGMAYNPGDGQIYLITKGGNAELFRLPKVLKNKMVAEKVCTLSDVNGVVTAFDIKKGEFLVRTYGEVYEYAVRKPELECTGLIRRSGYNNEGYNEKQGEAVGYLPTGGFVSISEGDNPKIYVFKAK